MHERPLENRLSTYPHWRIDQWNHEFPQGRIDKIYTHWSAHDYAAVFPAYHYCVATDPDGHIVVAQTNDPRANMRDVREDPEKPYAAHTRGRNSYAIGISIMAMEGSRPDDFGSYPLTEPLIDAMCLLGARIAAFYNVPIDAEHVMSHAEAALIDGYYGTGIEERWDIARLRPDPKPLEPHEGVTTGDELRTRMQRFRANLG
ncbi:MAG TPA: N-acetylmuramoyl-L-alanine amidase [Candidatus Baltobacteraceae bacterium]|nr:N-acetylmuramoyl-L-alanine amidase [Candidatus Baltobacteraceae bacterium]